MINKNFLSQLSPFYFGLKNNFHKIYYKTPPFSVGFRLSANKTKKINEIEKINFIAQVNKKNFTIDIYWKGGVETIFFERDLGRSYSKYNFKYYKKNILNLENSKNSKKELNALIPTNFMHFDFLERHYKVKQIFTNKFWSDKDESIISADEIIENFYDKEIFWIHRFTKFCERDFFKFVVSCYCD